MRDDEGDRGRTKKKERETLEDKATDDQMWDRQDRRSMGEGTHVRARRGEEMDPQMESCMRADGVDEGETTWGMDEKGDGGANERKRRPRRAYCWTCPLTASLPWAALSLA